MCFEFFPNDEITIYSQVCFLSHFERKHNLITASTRCDEMFYIISDLLRENFTKHALAKRAKEIQPALP